MILESLDPDCDFFDWPDSDCCPYYTIQITSDLDPYWLYKDPDPQNLMNADPDPGH